MQSALNLIHENIVERFAKLSAKGLLAHAYLFTGPALSGKSETAAAVARMVNCGEKAFRENCSCASCRKTEGGFHPDVYSVEGSFTQAIKIEQIRSVLERIQLKSFEPGRKIVIIKNAEYLTTEAGNALLKTLEEPSDNSLIILTASSPEKILPTIMSRCQSVVFPIVSRKDICRQLLSGASPEDKDAAHFLSFFSDGCSGKAAALQEEDFFSKKNELIDKCFSEKWDDQFIKDILSDKDETKVFLDVMATWIRDAMIVSLGGAEKQLMHADRREELSRFVRGHTFEDLSGIYQHIIQTINLLKENLNVKISLLVLKEMLWKK